MDRAIVLAALIYTKRQMPKHGVMRERIEAELQRLVKEKELANG
jgi:hypothetical protein